MLAGLAPGLITFTLAGFVCFDNCPTRAVYFAGHGAATVQVMTPCVVIEALALAVFLIYCLAARQARRAVVSTLFLLVGSLVGVAALSALLRHALATLPIWGRVGA